MNVFEFTFTMSVLIGMIVGGIVGKTFGALGIIFGVVGGLLVGLVCHFLVLGLSVGLAKVGRSYDEAPKNWLLFIPWWIANFTSVMMMVLSPVTTVIVLVWLTSLLKK